ncbi:MAG: trypsin-like serine protease [Bacteriovorax sp.]|nr:trypsin-like serine protease [Bacteriovorax sp.]
MIKKLISLIFSLALFCSFSNCFALTNSIVAESPEWTNVMQIKSEAPDSTGDTTPGYCNATLINHNVLITAAHCVKLAYISGMKKIDIQIGYYKYITRKTDGKLVRIGYVAKYNLTKNVNVELPRSLIDKISHSGEKSTIDPTEDVALIWWNEETPEMADIQVADIVSPAEHNSLIKNISQTTLQAVTVNPFSEMSLDTKRIATLNNFKWSGYVYSKSQSRVEVGDSGAPLFAKINGKFKILAVVKGKASTVFDNWDAYAGVNPHLCQMAELLPTFIKIEACK